MATRKQANKTWEELESIRKQLVESIFPSIQATKQELDRYHADLLVDTEERESVQTKITDLENKLTQLVNDAQEKASTILKLHQEVFQGGEEGNSIKKAVEDFLNNSQNLFSETEKKKNDFDSFYEKVFGKDDGNGNLVGGLKKELEKYQEKYNNLFEKINSLLPGATSAGLAKVFKDKVVEFAKVERKWSNWFLWIAILLTAYLGFYTFVQEPAGSFSESFLRITHKSPFLIFAVWLLVFIGNRRAESKKLEESYKHKEVMARAFVGYKEHIEELEDESTDKILLTEHMKNLLNAVNINSSDFLSNEGDKHPFWGKFTSKKIIKKVEEELNEK